MHVSLVVPGMLAIAPAALAACTPLASLAAHATVAVEDDGLECAALAAVHMRDPAVAPLAARGTGLDVGEDGWLCADPVLLVAGHEDVRLVDRVDDLAPGEASALRDRLDRLFAADGLAFETPRPDRWLLRVRGRPLPATTSLARARDQPLRALLPGGPDAGIWRRWLNEIQMLLHEDPVNDARIARGHAPASGIWLWGGGVFRNAGSSVTRIALANVRESDALRGAARASGTEPHSLPTSFSREQLADGDAAFVLHAVRDEAALAQLARHWLSPAVDALLQRAIGSLTLVADADLGPAVTWHAAAPSLAAKMRARLTRPGFSVPSAILSADRSRTRPKG